jgi:hypothetical protein
MTKEFKVIGNSSSTGGAGHGYEIGDIVMSSEDWGWGIKTNPEAEGYFKNPVTGLEQIVAFVDLQEVI